MTKNYLLKMTKKQARRRSAFLGVAATLACAGATSLGGCSASPSGAEATGRSASAVTSPPNTFMPPTTYQVTLTSIDVVAAQEPNLPSTPNTSPLSAPYFWSPDTGYVEWAELAARVSPAGAGITNPTFTSACVLTDGHGSTKLTRGATMSNCGAGGMQNGAYQQNRPLTGQFTVNAPDDSVAFAIALDNIESNDANGVTSQMGVNGIAVAGDYIGGVSTVFMGPSAGAAAAVAATATATAGVAAFIGAALAVAGDLGLGQPSDPSKTPRRSTGSRARAG